MKDRGEQRGLGAGRDKLEIVRATLTQSPAVSPPSLEVDIEEFVLHGFSFNDRWRIAEALGRELSRLLVEQGIPGSLGTKSEMGHVNGGSFEVTEGTKPETIGIQAAKAVFEGLGE